MTEEEAKTEGIHYHRRIPQRMAKNNKATHNLQETMTTCGLRNTEKQQEQSTKP